ncbi:MAG: hypothetical protein LBF85_01210 [Tannerella sp.]|nr:hypothetical protein [Tannerella sp.]
MHKKNKENHLSFQSFITGDVLKKDFIVKNTVKIGWLAFLLFVMIANRSICLMKLREIAFLEEELRNLKNQSVAISSELTGSNRLSEIEEMVKKQGIGIESAQTPPYVLYK